MSSELYDVFISYRRDDIGSVHARLLYHILAERGYKVVLDVKTLGPGNLNETIFDYVIRCDRLVLILSPGALDRCSRERDWVRREVEKAYEFGAAIIPVVIKGFEFPEDLPGSMEFLRDQNRLDVSMRYYDAFIGELDRFLKHESVNTGRPAQALYDLGNKYFFGRGVTQSDEIAAMLYRRAAKQGNARAQNGLGFMYDNGRGVPQSDEKAVEYYRLAAEQGDADAQCNLGFMYENGRGVAQSDEKAVEYYRLAAEQGDADAQCNLGWMYENGRGVARSVEKAVEYYRLAAEQGLARAQYNLGWMYENGRGVPQSDEKAVEYYRLAAEQGNADAQKALDRLSKG